MQTAILLHASLTPGPVARWADALLQALPYARRLQLEGVPVAARWASLGGVALALTGASRLGCPVRVGDLLFDGEAKPRLASGPYFSISHTADRVGCVVAAALDVGLDLERVPADAGHEALRRLRAWTATEATLKAAGRGLRHLGEVQADADARMAVLDGHRYLLSEIRLDAQTSGHVAATEALALTTVALELDASEVSAAVQRALGLASQRA